MNKSEKLFSHACKLIPGGVNSPVRAFRNIGIPPVFFERGAGSRLYDFDNTAYIDYVNSWGALLLGHAHPEILATLVATAKKGLSFGAPTELETLMAEKISTLMPALEMVRMVNSGTEATMSAIRLARGCTGRDKLVKFDGCYHGHADSLLVGAGSGVLTLGIPGSPGVPSATATDTLVLDYNNTEQLQQVFERYGREIACVIVEPVAGNMNFVPADKVFLETLRKLCDEMNSVLIFDEVMTGFRVGLNGAQSLYGIKPDLTTLGKVIGGGMPIGAFGGRSDLMAALAPAGEVYQAGTLSGNPLAMAVGLKTLELIEAPGFFEQLSSKTQRLCQGLREIAADKKIAFQTDHRGGMFGFFFSAEAVRTFKQVKAANQEHFKRFYKAMLTRNIYLAPSAYEAGFISAAHSDDDINATLAAANEAMRTLER